MYVFCMTDIRWLLQWTAYENCCVRKADPVEGPLAQLFLSAPPAAGSATLSHNLRPAYFALYFDLEYHPFAAVSLARIPWPLRHRRAPFTWYQTPYALLAAAFATLSSLNNGKARQNQATGASRSRTHKTWRKASDKLETGAEADVQVSWPVD